MGWLKAALGIAATAMVKDSVVRPRQIGSVARAYCDRVGKPLLLASEPRLLHRLIGEPVKADVTIHHAGRVPVPDKTFGSVVSVGLLERQARPDLVLEEWRRVAGTVFVVVPSWWSPTTWLNPEHRWYIDPELKRAFPLWIDRRYVYLLQVSDNGYGRRPWSPTRIATRPVSPPMSPSSPSMNSIPLSNSVPVPDFRSGSDSSDLSGPRFPIATTHLTTVGGDDLPDFEELGKLPFES